MVCNQPNSCAHRFPKPPKPKQKSYQNSFFLHQLLNQTLTNMPLYREDTFLVVHPGSQHTIFSFGLQDSLSPPQYKIPSVVYQDPETKEFKSTNEDNKLQKISPIVGSKIANVDAFNHLLKIILQSVISKHPIITINQIPLLIVAPTLAWSRYSVECVTKYVFETLEFSAFNIIDLPIASTFSIGASTNSLVVNVGQDSIQVVPVVGYQSVRFAGKYIPEFGGKTINEDLKKLLPSFSDSQIEALKTSKVFEVLNDTEGSFYSLAELNSEEQNDDDFDVADYVTKENSGAANGDESQKEETRPNSELEKNFFIDEESKQKIYVGKERFQGTSRLVGAIVEAIFKSLALIPDLAKRQDCYDNLIFVGSTFNIPGFSRAVLIKLIDQYLVRPPSDKSNADDSDKVNSAIAAYQQVDEVQDASSEGFTLSQVPTTIKLVKYPDYFPEWKKPKEKNGSWTDVYFLGAEIYAKQIFGANSNHGGDSFLDADTYEDKGPQAIWDVQL